MVNNSHGWIRVVYLYFFALAGLITFVIGLVNLSGAVLDRYVWPPEFVQYDYAKPASASPCVGEDCMCAGATTVEQQKVQFNKQQANQFRSRVNNGLPAVVIGWFLWLFHWTWIKRDKKED